MESPSIIPATAQKKLEKHIWPWPENKESVNEINSRQMAMLLTGIDFTQRHMVDMQYDCGFDIGNYHYRFRAGGLLVKDGKILKEKIVTHWNFIICYPQKMILIKFLLKLMKAKS